MALIELFVLPIVTIPLLTSKLFVNTMLFAYTFPVIKLFDNITFPFVNALILSGPILEVVTSPPILTFPVLIPPANIVALVALPNDRFVVFVPPMFIEVALVTAFNVCTLVVNKLNVWLLDLISPPSFICKSPDMRIQPLTSNKKFCLLLNILGIFK